MAKSKDVGPTFLHVDNPGDGPLPQAVVAASVTLAVLGLVGARRLGEFDVLVSKADADTLAALANIRLSREQVEALEGNVEVCGLVRAGKNPVTVCVCDGCGGVFTWSRASTPGRCPLSFGCEGTVIKAVKASRRVLPNS